MKITPEQRAQLLALFAPFEHETLNAKATVQAVEMILAVNVITSTGALVEMKTTNADDVYKRFMHEWKQVGVWQGGKPVRTKLARLAKAGQLDEVWAGLERLRNDPNRPAPEFVPRPMTWLNQERWNDDPYPERSVRQSAASAAASINLAQLDLSNMQSVVTPLGQRALNERSASLRGEIERGAL